MAIGRVARPVFEQASTWSQPNSCSKDDGVASEPPSRDASAYFCQYRGNQCTSPGGGDSIDSLPLESGTRRTESFEVGCSTNGRGKEAGRSRTPTPKAHARRDPEAPRSQTASPGKNSTPTSATAVFPPQALLDALNAVSRLDQPGPARSRVVRRAGVDSSPPPQIGSANTSPCVSARDRSGSLSNSANAPPSPDFLDHDPSSTSPKKPTIRKRRSWMTFTPRKRSTSIDALHSLSNLSILSSLKPLGGSRKDERASRGQSQQFSTYQGPATPPVSEEGQENPFASAGRGWGGATEQLWNSNAGVSDSGRCRSASHSSDAQHFHLPAPRGHKTHRAFKPHRTCRLFSKDDPAVQEWATFVRAYAEGQLDLNEPPRIPHKGVPDAALAPNLTHCDGPLFAPQPPWEPERQKWVNRLQLEDMPEERWMRVQGICNELKQLTDCDETIFSIIDGTAAHLWCVSSGMFPPGYYPRSHAMCAHTIPPVNRHDGLVVLDLEKDWRWSKNPLLESVGFYAAIPVCASDGLPLGALCCVDASPRDKFDDRELRLLQQLAKVIASELEDWSIECFQRKIDLIQEGWTKLDQHLKERPEVGPGTKIAPTIGLLASPRPTTNPSIDLCQIANLGLTVTWSDIGHMNYCASLISEAIDLETVYIAAVTPSDSGCVLIGSHALSCPVYGPESDVHLRALRSQDGGFVYHREPGETGGSDFLFRQGSNRYEAGIFCPVHFDLPDSTPSETGGSELPAIQESKAADTSQEAALPPHRRSCILSTDVCPAIGFVVAALTKSKRRVLGIEDVRYLEGFADVIGALWKKCLPSAVTTTGEANDEAAKIATARATELSRKSQQSSYLSAGKKAMKATGEGLNALMRGMHLHPSKSSTDLSSNVPKRPSLRRQRTLASATSQSSADGDSATNETGSDTSQGPPGRSARPVASLSRTASGSSSIESKSAKNVAVRCATPASVPFRPTVRQHLLDSLAESVPFQPMGALPGKGLRPSPRKSRARVCCS